MKCSDAVLASLSGFALVLLTGCSPGPKQAVANGTADAASPVGSQVGQPKTSQEMQQGVEYLGTDSTCHRPREKNPTTGVVKISVEGDTIVLDPDPVVQEVAAGHIGWKMDQAQNDYAWQVIFKNDDSPLPETLYVGVGSAEVGAPVRKNAACKSYPYTVTVLTPTGPVRRDPMGDIVP